MRKDNQIDKSDYPALTAAAPVVSVCIANYNGESMLRDCIDSVLSQSGSIPIEVIVHDDDSSDGSVELLRTCYPNVVLIVSESNAGFCIANNRMVDIARGNYVLLLNNDAALFPNALEALLAEAAASNAAEILTLPQFDWEDGSLVDRGCLLDPFLNPIPNHDPAVSEVAYGIGACLFLPRDTWHWLGGFPEWMGSLTEDLYICGIARLRGLTVRALSGSGYRHRQGASFGGNRAGANGLHSSIRRRQLSERNKTRALVVLTPGLAVAPLLIAHLLALAAEGIALSILRMDALLWRKVYAPALLVPFREAGALIKRRRDVQANRCITVGQWFSTVRWQLRKLVLLAKYGVPKVS